MSMSQEEIEALMNGLDIDESESEDNNEEASEDNSSTVNQEELDELVSSSNSEDNSKEEKSTSENKQDSTSEHEPKEESVEEKEQSNSEETQQAQQQPKEDEQDSSSQSKEVDNDDIDSLLNEFDDNQESNKDSHNDSLKQEEDSSDDMSDDDIDNMLSQIDGVSDDESSQENSEPSQKENSNKQESKKEESKKEEPKKKKPSLNEDDIVNNWTNTKINEGVIPLPADKDTKVVSQLNQVANDSEEKVSRIFDVLSLGLDNNNDFRTKITDIEKLLLNQEKLLKSLNSKFPNIEVFKEHIAQTKRVNEGLESLKDSMNDEDMKIFEAMELMQFNDINRQKIERVMSVIRKLSLYLNNLFEDEYTEQEIAVAKHIHGDEAEDLIGDDLDKLIEEFGKNNN
ncbi:MAG: hypothetical protein ACQERD_06170 [Campylobacterota bacterium]